MQLSNKLLNLNLPIILASNSPRRKKLLEGLGLTIEIIPSNIDENMFDINQNPIQYTSNLSLLKAEDISNKINKNCIIIAADTIVVFNEKILNKPIDENDAFKMLKLLSGNIHFVYTGVTLIDTKNNHKITKVKKTEVTFRILEEEEIYAYIATGSPMDKAGAYGIQDDYGAVFVSNISGCYYNIVGLPLEMLFEMLKEINS